MEKQLFYNSKLVLLSSFCVLLSTFLFSQNDFSVTVNNIKEGDSVRVIVQKSSEFFFKKWIYSSDSPHTAIFSLNEGQWSVKLDATGYTYPSQQVVTIPNDTAITFSLTEATDGNYSYNWRDDGSAAGHATQSYAAEPTQITVINNTVSVPTNFSSIKLRSEYGVILSDDIEPWSNEDAYRLYKMFSNLPDQPYGEGTNVDYSSGENIRGVFYLSNEQIFEDISIDEIDGIRYATVSQSAFTYANPQIVELDGIRGKFFSKRLYHAVVNFVTNFAQDEQALNNLALDSFGIQFLKPGEELETLMNEDSSNFQEFYNSEKLEILAMFEELPEGFHKQEGLKYIVRRIDGQDHPLPAYKPAAAIAWTGMETIEFMSKAFVSGNLSDTRRLILHEKAHFLWEYTFDDSTKDDWIEIGGWFEDPTSPSGWSTDNTTEFVSAYAHAKNPNEDMAESIAIYLTNPDRLINVSMKKYEFIRDRIMHGTRYVAQIREDLTFTVYNLYPDYVFPGKIIELDLEVDGAPDEDKTVTMTVVLDSDDPSIDGAVEVYTRFSSSIGTIFDIRLLPQNGSIDSILVGSATLSRYSKSGYWNMGSAAIYDQVRNQRYENTSTVGAKLWIENPLEDVISPKFLEYSSEKVEDNFNVDLNHNAVLSEDGISGQAIKVISKWEEPLNVGTNNMRIDFPNPDQSETYFKELGLVAIDQSQNIKEMEGYLFIEEYFPTGYYGFVEGYIQDEAGNSSWVQFVNDIDDYPYADNSKTFVAVRDSIYIETEFPDIVKPEIDINNITVIAEPTNPEAPNGETRVDINFNARDLSDFPGNEAGVRSVSLVLRDPQGREFGYQTGNSTMNHPDLDLADTEPTGNSDWENYRFDLVLPQGSAPGVWGISDIIIQDKVGNTRSYNFVEYVRFDTIDSDIVLTSPLEIEILDKVINAGNVNSVKVKMSCDPCEGLNYVATIYSRYGGGTVVRNEGTLSANEVVIENMNTGGILDGEVNLTVQLTDTENKLVATKTTAYTKDVVYPKSYYTRSNLQNDGTSSLDDFLIDVVVESVDVGGTYNATVQSMITGSINTANNHIFSSQNSIGPLQYTGEITSTEFNISQLDLSSLGEGYIEIKLVITDPNGNTGQEPYLEYYRIKGNIIQYVGNTPEFDSDDDGVLDDIDQCSDTPVGETADENGCSDSQKDTDNDGFTDDIDQCPDTPAGALVDVNGCEVFTLPVQNFKVEVGSATCVGNSDGIINLSIEDASYDYSVTITGRDNVTIAGDSKTASITGLPKGTYSVCFEVDGEDNFEQCFEVEVNEPQALSAFMEVNGQNLNITMSGSSQYNIDVNGNTQITSSNNFETVLSSGLNIIKVYTSLKCQGFVEEQILISEEVYYYPNPTQNDLNILVGGKDENVSVSVLTINGSLIYSRKQHVSDISRKTVVDLSKQTSGTYIVVIESETVSQTFKIIKE